MLLWASLYHVIGIENSRHVLNQSDVLLNTIATWLATFPRAWSRLHVLTSSSHSRCFSFPVLFGLAVPFATVWVYNTQLESSLNACATETIEIKNTWSTTIPSAYDWGNNFWIYLWTTGSSFTFQSSGSRNALRSKNKNHSIPYIMMHEKTPTTFSLRWILTAISPLALALREVKDLFPTGTPGDPLGPGGPRPPSLPFSPLGPVAPWGPISPGGPYGQKKVT